MGCGVTLATKGIIGQAIPLATKGIICIVETALTRRKRFGAVEAPKQKKRVTIFFNYEGIHYEHKVFVNSKDKINVNNIEIYTDEANKPKIKFKIDE